MKYIIQFDHRSDAGTRHVGPFDTNGEALAWLKRQTFDNIANLARLEAPAGWSVHDQPDFERTYDEDDQVEVRRGDLRALLDVATGSMDFGSGFLDNEQVEVLRKMAGVLGIDPILSTPSNFVCQYRGTHEWEEWPSRVMPGWRCIRRGCEHRSAEKPAELVEAESTEERPEVCVPAVPAEPGLVDSSAVVDVTRDLGPAAPLSSPSES